MTRMTWDERDYQTGIDRGVFYPRNSPGEVWNGIVSVEESPTDSSERTRYIDGVRIARSRREDSFSATLSAYTYPNSFVDVISQRRHQGFGLSYRASDQIHIVYNANATPSGLNYTYKDPGLYNWNISTVPLPLPEGGSTAHLVVDPSVAYPSAFSDLEDVLYGTETTESRLPTISDVLDIFEENSILRVVDNGDGTFTVTGPDEAIQMITADTFQISWPSAVYIDTESYTIHSL